MGTRDQRLIAPHGLPQKNASRDAGTSDSNTAAPTAIESKNGGVLLLGDQGAALRGVQVDAKKDVTVKGAKVEEAHKQWDYKQQGLTPEGAAIVTLVAAYFAVGPASAAGSAAGDAAAVAAGQGVVIEGAVFAAGSGVGAVVGGAVTAGLSALASQVAVALINNRGDLGATLHELGSSANVKNLLTAIATGGVLAGLNLNPTGLPTVGGGTEQFMTQLGQNIQGAAAKALIGTAINGGSLEDNLKNSLKAAFIDTLAAQAANAIGTWTQEGLIDGFTNKVAHAIAGCVAGAAKAGNGSGCGPGALGAAVGEAAAELYGRNGDTVQLAAMVGGIAAAAAGGGAAAIDLAAQWAAISSANNYLAHVHKKLAWDAARAAGLGIVAADLISGAVVTIDFQGVVPGDGPLGYSIQAQDIEHAHMHGMCASGSTMDACAQRVADYRTKLWEMNSLAGLAGLLHLYQDEFAPGHANLHSYDGTVDLKHIIGDLSPSPELSAKIVGGSAKIIQDYLARCKCSLSKK